MSKYCNKKTDVDGIKFDSVKEANYYCELKMRKMAKDIVDFDLQVPFVLQEPYKHEGKTIRAIKYIADFVIHHNDGTTEVIDVKGMRTEVYKLKKKLLLYKNKDMKFTEV